MMRLCLALGGMTLEELKSRMSAREFALWQVADRLHPFGDVRADMRSGIIADLFVAAHGGRPRGAGSWVIKPQKEEREVTDIDEAGLVELFGLSFEASNGV